MSVDETLASVSPVKQSKELRLFGTALRYPKDNGCALVQAPPAISEVLLGRGIFIYSQWQAGDTQPNVNRAP